MLDVGKSVPSLCNKPLIALEEGEAMSDPRDPVRRSPYRSGLSTNCLLRAALKTGDDPCGDA